ncbi:MAG: glutaredoxin 3 [Marinicellaceae bacterium]
MTDVLVYGTLLCPYCYAAKKLLKQKGIVFNEIRVDKKSSLKQEMITRSGRFTVPQIFIKEYHVGGYDDLVDHLNSGKLDSLMAANIEC